jgi:hypothetical protein
MPGMQLPSTPYDDRVWSYLRIWYCKLAALGPSHGIMGRHPDNCMVHDNILSHHVHHYHYYCHHCKYRVRWYAPLLFHALPSYRPQEISSIPHRRMYVLSLFVQIRLVSKFSYYGGCPTDHALIGAIWVPSIIFEIVLFGMLFTKLFAHARQSAGMGVPKLIQVLNRDGIVYFVVIFCAPLIQPLQLFPS